MIGKRKLAFGLTASLITLILIQFVPKTLRQQLPSEGMIQVDPVLMGKLERACFDCHSHETVWPWYSNVAPVSFLIERDVKLGRARVNFSNWENFGDQRRNKLVKKIIKHIKIGDMPPSEYTLLHPEAVLTQQEKDSLMDFFRGLSPSMEK